MRLKTLSRGDSDQRIYGPYGLNRLGLGMPAPPSSNLFLYVGPLAGVFTIRHEGPRVLDTIDIDFAVDVIEFMLKDARHKTGEFPAQAAAVPGGKFNLDAVIAGNTAAQAG